MIWVLTSCQKVFEMTSCVDGSNVLMTILTGLVEVELHLLSELDQMKITLLETVFEHTHANLITLPIFLSI